MTVAVEPWIIPPDGMSRWRWIDARHTEIEIQHREVVSCNGCGQRVLTFPGEHERSARLIQHTAGCRYASGAR